MNTTSIPGVFTPVLAKHSESFNLINTLAIGVDRIQRNFEPIQRQVERVHHLNLLVESAKSPAIGEECVAVGTCFRSL